MADILKEIEEHLPDNAEISLTCFEGANIILYTKSKEFLFNNNNIIKDIVSLFKKRVELRPDPSICMELERAQATMQNILPEEAKVGSMLFDPQRSIVVIEAEKPGLVIGKSGELLREVKKQTLWVPVIKRTPSIKSKLIENIRQVLYENNDFRKKFLNSVGKRIYSDWTKGRKDEWVRITFLGGARQVGRSCIFLQTPESRILLDCGINPAASDEQLYPYFDAPEFKIGEIDAVVASHAHLDHSAMIPLLFKYGYEGPVYCTEPTRDTMALLALDYLSISHKDAKKQIFTSTEVKEMVKHTICLEHEEVTDITPDVRLTLYNAGHTLGSSMVHLHIGNGLHNLLYTADFNYETSNLLASAVTKFPRLETLIIEATYGGKDDVPPSRQECENILNDIVGKTAGRGGKVLMPVLGVGRSQEVMLILEKAMKEGKIPQIPIYIQGMVWDMNAIHTAYPDYFNKKVRKLVFHQNQNPFLSDIFKQVGSQKEMQEVIESGNPCVIMATSGMMIGGPSVEYFRSLAENPKHSIVFTCYQAEGSLGRRIISGEKEISFQTGAQTSETIRVKMDVHAIHGFSGHSNRNQLLNFVYHLSPKPKRIIINHGESSKCLDLASSLHKLHKVETNTPRNLDAIRLR